MVLFLYNVFCKLFLIGVKGFSFFNPKAKKWISGRRGWRQNLESKINKTDKYIWMHCSSLGEFEQGRPLIEMLKAHLLDYKIILTFFSPSGYEIQKNYKLADTVFYMPMDSKKNATDFLKVVKPALAIFVKYEYWYHYLYLLKHQQIPVILVSATFRPNQHFFKWYGGFFRKMIICFDLIFVQEEDSKKLLSTIRISNNVIVAGDTRYDRVAAIATGAKKVDFIEQFANGCNLIIAGSTWREDEILLFNCLPVLPKTWKLVLAPHEVDSKHIQEIQKIFGTTCTLYSEFVSLENDDAPQVLIIDNIGMLSSLYAYGAIAYVGGGFNKGGIHNILEPAVFGIPILFGLNYKKFVEANKMVALKYAFPISTTDELAEQIKQLIIDDNYRDNIHNGLLDFMQQNLGATNKIFGQIIKMKWLV